MYRVKFRASWFIVYTEWFSSLEEATEVVNAMQRDGIDVMDIEDDNYEENEEVI